MSYTKPTITGYNTSPPADDGSATEANKVKWSTIKGKLTDPAKTYADDINNAVDAAFTNLDFNTYDSKAAAVLVTPTNGTLYYIGGTDGGFFEGITGASPGTYADDGGSYCGTVFIPTGGDGSACYSRIYSSEIDTKWFGSSTNATASVNYAAITAALDAAEALSYRISVYIKGGLYLINNTLRLRRNVLLYGDGYDETYGTTIKLDTAANCTIVDTQNVTFSQYHGIKNICLHGNKGNQSAGSYHGLHLKLWDVANTLDHVKVQDCAGIGVYFDGTGSEIGNVEAYGLITVRNDGGGIYVKEPHNSISFYHCIAEGNGLSTNANWTFDGINDQSIINLISCRGEGRTLANGGGNSNIDLLDCNGGLLNIFGGYYMGTASHILSAQMQIKTSAARINSVGTTFYSDPSTIIDDQVNATTLTYTKLGSRNRGFRWNLNELSNVDSSTSRILRQFICASGNLFTVTASNATPSGVVSAAPGSLHIRTSGGDAGALYQKRSGTGNTGWVKFSRNYVGSDVGDAGATLTVASSPSTNIWASAITADRSVTLSTTEALSGDKFRIVRRTTATGAYNLNVGTGPLKALAAGTWCDVEFDGTNWILTAYGSL